MKPASSPRTALGLIGWILLTFLAPALGAFTGPETWYQTLHKPDWNPPNWLFGPVWTVLYLSMAVAAWQVWKRGGQGRALRIYLAHLVLNAAWTPVFFGAQQIGLALVVIILLWLSIVLTLRAFWVVTRPAGMLLVPYLAWVSFATFLNFTLWRLNP